MQFGFSEATASSSHLQILPLLCVIGESPSLKMYGHKLWQSPAIGSSWRAKFGSLDQTGSKTFTLSITFFQFLSFPSLPSSGNVTKFIFFISIYEAKVMILNQTVINQLWLILCHPPCCCNIFIQTYTTFTLWKQQYMNKGNIIGFFIKWYE